MTLKKPFRVVAAVLITLAGVTVVGAVYGAMLTDKSVAERDFISYWSAGQLLVRGQNPYDFKAVKALEQAAGRDPHELLLMMRNPPTAFLLVWPLGFAGPRMSLMAWLAVLLAALSLSIFLIWRMNGRPNNLFHLLGYAFAPALVCLMAGQFGIVMLLGVTLFLYQHHTHPFWAGAALALCALKPHYFLAFGVALLLWSVTAKTWRILAGLATGVAMLCASAWALDPHGWQQYTQMMHAGGALNEVIPQLSAQLRLLVPTHPVWVQFVPQAAACLWAAWYFFARRAVWNWQDHGLLVLLVSAMCSPFGWFFDESVLLPAVLAGVYRATEQHRPIWPIFVIGGAALAEALAGVLVISPFYLWTTPAWLAWYLYATGRLGRRRAKA